MDKAGLLVLADRVEALTGPDLEVDCLIENALGIAKFERDPRVFFGDADYNRVSPKPYTASLDAAMTLVPDGWYWSIKSYPKAGCVGDIGGIHSGYGPTPAITLTTAALRARASQ